MTKKYVIHDKKVINYLKFVTWYHIIIYDKKIREVKP